MIEFPFLLAIASAVIAHKQKRSAVLWFAIGFFVPVLGLVILLLVGPPKGQQEESDGEQAATTTKLRNQLRLERNRRQEVERLLRCGQELNFAAASAKMNPESFTKKSHPAQPLQQQDSQQSHSQQSPLPMQELNIPTHWHIHIGQDESRYLSISEISALYQAGAISETSLVWCEGMDDWGALESTDLYKAME